MTPIRDFKKSISIVDDGLSDTDNRLHGLRKTAEIASSLEEFCYEYAGEKHGGRQAEKQLEVIMESIDNASMRAELKTCRRSLLPVLSVEYQTILSSFSSEESQHSEESQGMTATEEKSIEEYGHLKSPGTSEKDIDKPYPLTGDAAREDENSNWP